MLFDILPVHLSYIVKNRESTAWFLKNVLGLSVIRHDEYKVPSATSCPTPLFDQWCKTSFAFGPNPANFAVQQVYSYKGYQGFTYGNDFAGGKMRSLETLARAKAFGIKGRDEPDGSYFVCGQTGHGYWLYDHHDHEGCRPYTSEVMRVSDFTETFKYWHSYLGVDVIDLQKTQFSLFFGNGYPNLTFVQSPVPLVLSPAHLGFTMPKDQLQEMSSLMLRSGTVVHQPFGRVAHTGRNSDYLVILKDPSGYFLYFYDLESFELRSKYDPQADARFNISLLKEREERTRVANANSSLDLLKQPSRNRYV